MSYLHPQIRRPHPLVLGSLVAVMVAAWSLNFVIGKIGLKHLAPLSLASFRVVFAGFLMLPIYLLYGRGSAAPAGTQEVPLRPGDALPPAGTHWREEFTLFALLGLLGVVGNQVCFTVGLSYTTVGHSSLIIGMGPIFILLLAWAQGLEALTPRKVLGMAIAFAGVAALAAEHGVSLRSATLRGDLITMAGSFSFALYTVLGKKVASVYDTVRMNAFNYFAGATVVLPLAGWQAMRLTRTHGWGAVGWQGWAAVAYMAVFGSVVAYLIYYWALRYTSASRLGALSYLQPVITTGLGVGLLGEELTSHLLLGGALVLLGVYLIESGPGNGGGRGI